MSYPVKVFSTRGSDVLAKAVCEALKTRLPKDLWSEGCLKPGKIKVVRFSNENLQVQVENVRDHFVVVIHSQVPPVNERLVELFCLLDALKGARPVDILVVFPCYPYARSDKKNQPRISTMAYRFAHILNYSFGIERVMLLDPHDDHIKHYFDPVADEITSIYLLFDYLERNVFTFQPKEESVLVFPDEGASKRYSGFARLLRIPTAYIDKGRSDDREQPEVKGIIGNVEDKFCLMIDDEILTLFEIALLHDDETDDKEEKVGDLQQDDLVSGSVGEFQANESGDKQAIHKKVQDPRFGRYLQIFQGHDHEEKDGKIFKAIKDDMNRISDWKDLAYSGGRKQGKH